MKNVGDWSGYVRVIIVRLLLGWICTKLTEKLVLNGSGIRGMVGKVGVVFAEGYLIDDSGVDGSDKGVLRSNIRSYNVNVPPYLYRFTVL